jgi:predicted DCC family thiol-disulfide oxidoreductase YuxK
MIPIDMARDATPSPTASSGRWTVLYDPDCGLCRWCTATLLSWDRARRLRPLALGSEEADRLLDDLTPQQRLASWHLISPAGERRSAGAALPALLEQLPRGALAARVLARAPRASERGYRWVAEHRVLLSRAIPAAAKRRASERLARVEAADRRSSPGSSG